MKNQNQKTLLLKVTKKVLESIGLLVFPIFAINLSGVILTMRGDGVPARINKSLVLGEFINFSVVSLGVFCIIRIILHMFNKRFGVNE